MESGKAQWSRRRVKKNLFNVQALNIEDIPNKHRTDELYDKLPINGGNVVNVNKTSAFGVYLAKQGYVFEKDWGWLVIFR